MLQLVLAHYDAEKVTDRRTHLPRALRALAFLAHPVVAAIGRHGRSYCRVSQFDTFTVVNPGDGTPVATVARASRADVDVAVAVAAARAAFAGPWSGWKPYDRQRAIVRLADLVEAEFDDLSLLDSLSMGAPWARTRISRRPVSLLHWYAAQAVSIRGDTIPNSFPFGDVTSYTLREPVGVVARIIPWNGPIPASIWKLGPVLATGCTIVLKPAEEASLAALDSGSCAWKQGSRRVWLTSFPAASS